MALASAIDRPCNDGYGGLTQRVRPHDNRTYAGHHFDGDIIWDTPTQYPEAFEYQSLWEINIKERSIN